jgi:hypothetical protein
MIPPATAYGLFSRESILELLDDVELSRVSSAGGVKHLTQGEEYIDLIDLTLGVQTAQPSPGMSPVDSVRRVDVAETTWAKILLRVPAC